MTSVKAELPKGWAWSTVGEIGDYLNGRGFKKSEWRASGRPIIRIQNLTGSNGRFNYYEGEAEERHTVRAGDLLVSWAATLGVFVWSGPEAVLNQHIFKVRSHINLTFHRWVLEHLLETLYGSAHGSGMVHVTRGAFEAVQVTVPPLVEQERIVAAIEEHLSRLDAAEAQVTAASRRLGLADASLVNAVLDGDWPMRRLAEHTLDQRYGTSAKTGARGEVPVLRMGNIQAGALDLTNLKYLPADHEDFPACLLEPGDLLFNRTNSGELVGKTAVFKGTDRPMSFASYLIRVRLDDELMPEWAALAMNSAQGRRYIDEVRTQNVGQSNVNGTKLKAFPIPVPPMGVQRDRVSEVEGRRDGLRRFRSDLDAASATASALRRSILAAAFSGRLVAQDPSDASADALLAQLASERPPTASGRKRVPT